MSEVSYKPESTRKFTLKDLSDVFNKNEEVLRGYIHKYGIPFTLEVNDNSRKEIIITYESYLKLKTLIMQQVKHKIIKEKQNVSNNLSELKKLHPLVTDERCFRLSWFPENVLHACDDSEWRGY